MRLPDSHPLRYVLNNEIHARPAEEFSAPTQISYIALLYQPDSNGLAFADLEKLCEMSGAAAPRAGANHFQAALGSIRVKWERHTEFVTYTFSRVGEFDEPFSKPVIAQIPGDWLANLSGSVLVAMHLAIRNHRKMVPDLREVAEEFSGNYLVGSKVGGGKAIVLTDFRIHEDGFSRILLMDIDLGKRQGGRMVQRLVELEAYRMLALMALPVAREVGAELPHAERNLAEITATLALTSPQDESALLDRLTRLAARLEDQFSVTSFRFGAARAYYALVNQRIGELREERLVGVQTIEEFMGRRLAPAMNTCESTSRRLLELSERIARASGLLRTRVDVEREQQNLLLLASMDRRSNLQLRLQQTVEGLSVAAITYYASALIRYLAEAVQSLGLPVNPPWLSALSIPVIAVGVWWGLRRYRRRLELSGSGGDHEVAAPVQSNRP